MSRTLSAATIEALNSADTSEIFLILLTIETADPATPIRAVNNTVDVVSNGNTFTAFPFRLSLPTDSEEIGISAAKLSIDNIDRQIVTGIRFMTFDPEITMEVVRAADPDTIEASFGGYRLKNVTYDHLTVSGDLTIESFLLEPFPSGVMGPGNFKGIF